MSPLFIAALVLILAGLLMAWGRSAVPYAVLSTILLWVGLVLIAVGLVFLITPVLLWLDHQLRAVVGV